MCDGCDEEPGCADGPGRTRLWEIDKRLHCSIVGTCLTLGDLRRIAGRLHLEPLKDASDFQVHGSFCLAAAKPGPIAKQMQKMLDRRYRVAVRRFSGATDAAGLAQLWAASLDEGDIPGPYWALMTHPAADEVLLMRAFGQVHMLSHLMGAANRADIRRLMALEAERNTLSEALSAARRRIAEQERGARRMLEGHAAEVRDLLARLSKAASLVQHLQAAEDRLAEFETGEAYRALRCELGASQEALARAEREAQEERLLAATLAQDNERLHQRLHRLDASLQAVAAECEAVEMVLRDQLSADLAGEAAAASAAAPGIDLCGRRIVYVGGRGGIVPHLRALVERSGGIFLHHDGGLEEQSARLDSLLGQGDAVFCPVDCVSHDACVRAKRACRQRATTFVPLRTCSLSSFAEGLRQLSHGEADRPALR